MNPVLVLALLGRDAAFIEQSLKSDDITCRSVPTIAALCDCFNDESGAAVIFEEAFPDSGLAKLVGHLERQPAWSDFPLIILTASGVSEAMARIFSRLSTNSYVTLLPRPLHPQTLRTAVRVALSARRASMSCASCCKI